MINNFMMKCSEIFAFPRREAVTLVHCMCLYVCVYKYLVQLSYMSGVADQHAKSEEFMC